MYKNRRYQNEKRAAVEKVLRDAGLHQVAGGERFTYFGLPSSDPKVGRMVRVGAKAFRMVKRYRGMRGIEDLTVGSEQYHGKVNLANVAAWAAHLAATDMGQRKDPPPPKPTAPAAPAPDISIENQGSLVLLRPDTPAGREWLDANLQVESWQRFGDAIAVEPRCVPDIAAGAAGDGLTVEASL